MTTYEKLVDGATKLKLAPPKPKYVEPILIATASGERSDEFRTVMKALDKRLQSSVWTMVYKSLIVLHIMIREGDDHTTIKYLANHLSILDIKIGKNGRFISNGGELDQIYRYARYIACRAKEYGATGHDFIRETKKPYGSWDSHDKSSVLRELSIEKGLLRETESVQKQIDVLLQCQFEEHEVNNDLIVLGFRMLTTDLVSLYQCLNEGVLNILEHFFDLSKPDATRAFEIYDYFAKQTKRVIQFLRTAKHLESVTKLKVPTIKHAQTSLSNSLREYLYDPDFEINRRQYLAEKRYSKSPVKKQQPIKDETKKNEEKNVELFPDHVNQEQLEQQKQMEMQQQMMQQQMLEQQVLQVQATQNAIFEQQAQAAQANQQAQQFAQQQMLQAQMTQNAIQQPQQQQNTGFNPFSANMNSFSAQPVQQQPVQQQPVQQQPQQVPPPQASTFITTPLQPIRALSHNFTGNGFGNIMSTPTGNNIMSSPTRKSSNNPFSNSRFNSDAGTTAFTHSSTGLDQNNKAIKPNMTGTNPFRLETNIQPIPTQQGLQSVSEIKPQPTAGGLERLPTIPVFPETQREVYQQGLQYNAGVSLNNEIVQQRVAQNPFSAQATGMVQQAQMQPQQQFQQQQQQYQPQYQQQQQQQQQQPQQQQFQQPQFQQQMQPQMQMQSQQQQPQMYSNVYTGPNLLG